MTPPTALRVGPIGSTTSVGAPTWQDYELMWAMKNIFGAGVANVAGGEFAVAQRGAGANLSVDVAAGNALVSITNTNLDGTTYNVPFYCGVTTNVPITTADPTNPRIDIICLKVLVNTNPDSGAGNIASIVAIAGTPAGSPAVPSTPANCLKLAEIAVAAGAASIVTGNITDRRVPINPQTNRFPGLALESEASALRDDTPTWLGTITGTNTLTGSTTPAKTAYVAGQRFAFIVAVTNTTGVTLNVNSLGAKIIYRQDGATAVIAGDMIAGQLVEVRYDGTNFQMMTPSGTPMSIKMLSFYISTADSAQVASTTSETNFSLNKSFASTDFAVGNRFRVRAWAHVNLTNTKTATFNLKFGSVKIHSSGNTPVITNAGGGVDGNMVYIDAEILVTAIGASGTVACMGNVSTASPTGFTGTTLFGSWTTGNNAAGATLSSGAIDMTTSQTFQISVTMNNNSANDACVLQRLLIEKILP